jgi:hypothetical protein
MHICMDEVMAALAAVPMVGYCIRCLTARLRARKGR